MTRLLSRVRTVQVLTLILLVASTLAVSVRILDAKPETRSFAFVARGDNPIDALAAAPIAGRLNAPVLLTPPAKLDPAARQGLLDAAPDVVIIAGGVSAISSSVFEQIGDLLPSAEVRRVAGTSRYTTAEALAALVGEYAPSYLLPGDAAAPPTQVTETARCTRYDFVPAGLVPQNPWFTNYGAGDASWGLIRAADGSGYEDVGCSFHLPAGATVTRIRALYQDSSSTSEQGGCTFRGLSAVDPPVAFDQTRFIAATTDAFDGGLLYVDADPFESFTVRADAAYEVYCRLWADGCCNGLVSVEVAYRASRVPGAGDDRS